MRRKALDLVLAILIVAGLIYGASALGDAVTRESKEGIAGDPPSAQATPTASSAESRDYSQEIRVALFVVAGVVGVAIILSATSALLRSRHRPPPPRPRYPGSRR